MQSYQVNKEGYYGEYGGAYVPEILYKTVESLKEAYLPVIESEAFQKEYRKNVVLANAAFAIKVMEPEKDIPECLGIARESLESGKASDALQKFITLNS